VRARPSSALLLLVVLVTGCSGSSPSHPAAPAVPPMPGGLAEPALRALLLQPADVPSAPTRRTSATPGATTQPAPQLGLCRALDPVGPHQVASVLAKPTQPGQAQVFELVSVFSDAGAATAAFTEATAAADACPSFTQDGTAFTLEDVGRPTVVGADAVLQYRLTTADVVSGDVRTVARAGRYLVLITGFGAPPDGQAPLPFQAGVLAKAVARLPRS
jgi:hypothetical protein